MCDFGSSLNFAGSISSNDDLSRKPSRLRFASTVRCAAHGPRLSGCPEQPAARFLPHAHATATLLMGPPCLRGRRRQPSRPKPKLSASFLVPQAVAPGPQLVPRLRAPVRGSRP
eukprot:scaffold25594_cov60-Phaeocystis_antarctica.AAC.1